MKLAFEMVGNDKAKIKITVKIDTNKANLTKDESIHLKTKLENRVYDVLRSAEYDVSQIQVRR